MEHKWNFQADDGKPKIYTSIEKKYTDDNREIEPAVIHVVGFTKDTFNIVALNNLGEVTIMGSKIELSTKQAEEVTKFVDALVKLSV